MNARIQTLAKYGGIVAVVIEWASIAAFYAINPTLFNGEQPLSYFATIPETRLIFSVCYSLAAFTFWLFAAYHLPRYYVAPVKTFTVSMLGFAGVALVPFSFDSQLLLTIHNLLAFVFTGSFILGMYQVARHNTAMDVKAVSYGLAALGLVCFALFYGAGGDSGLVLLFEMAVGLVCQLWMIWMSFHLLRKDAA